MLEGTARLMLESGDHPGAMKDAVCSPGGSTIAGVRVLEQRAFRSAAMDAVIAAAEKTKELDRGIFAAVLSFYAISTTRLYRRRG